MERVPMTVEGHKRMEEELHRLKAVERPRIIQAIAEARRVVALKAGRVFIDTESRDLRRSDLEAVAEAVRVWLRQVLAEATVFPYKFQAILGGNRQGSGHGRCTVLGNSQ